MLNSADLEKALMARIDRVFVDSTEKTTLDFKSLDELYNEFQDARQSVLLSSFKESRLSLNNSPILEASNSQALFHEMLPVDTSMYYVTDDSSDRFLNDPYSSPFDMIPSSMLTPNSFAEPSQKSQLFDFEDKENSLVN